MTKLTKEDITNKIKSVAEENEETVDEVRLTYKGFIEFFNEKLSRLSNEQIKHRALNGLDSYYSNDDDFDSGEPFMFVCMGIASNPRDVNKKLREEIMKDFSDPEKRKDLIKNGKLMVMKISDEEIDGENIKFEDVYKPVTKIDKTIELDSGEIIVTEGEIWKNTGDKPISRDYRRYLEYGKDEYENSRWSQPLDPLWKMKLFGIGYLKGSTKGEKKNIKNSGVKTILSLSGEKANPNSPKFILRKPVMFSPIILKAILKDSSDKLRKNIWIRRDSNITYSGKDIKVTPMVDNINERIRKEALTLKKKIQAKKAGKDVHMSIDKLKSLYDLYKDYMEEDYEYIPEIDLSEIHNFHVKYKAIKEDGNIIKNDSGWDVTKFMEWALCNCTFKGVYENEQRGNKYVLRDWSLSKDENAWMKYAKGLPTEIPSPSAVIVSIQTSRGNRVYDEDIEEWIVDEEKAKAFGRVKGIKVLADFNEDSIEKIKDKIIEGDM